MLLYKKLILNIVTLFWKRTRIDWYDYFMGIAILSEQRTEEHCYPVGACIVNDNKIIVGTGYNGLTNGCKNKKDRSLYGMTEYIKNYNT